MTLKYHLGYRKHCNKKEKLKLLVTSNFSFSHNVFHGYISLVCQNAVLCGNELNSGDVGKQPVAKKECCVESCLKDFQESMNRCTGCCNITVILLKIALNTIQSNNRKRKDYDKKRKCW